MATSPWSIAASMVVGTFEASPRSMSDTIARIVRRNAPPSTITPIGERGRNHRYASTTAWFILGATLGGATLGLGVALLAAGVGGGLYLIGWPSRVVDTTYSGWRATFFLFVMRLAGAAMVAIGLWLLYLVYWLATGGPGD